MERMLNEYDKIKIVIALDDKIKQWETLERLIEASEWLKTDNSEKEAA